MYKTEKQGVGTLDDGRGWVATRKKTTLLPRKKVWRHLENKLTNYQNIFKIIPLITLGFGIILFLINQYNRAFREEFLEPFQVDESYAILTLTRNFLRINHQCL